MSAQSERRAIILSSCFCLLVAGVVIWPGHGGGRPRPLLELKSRERGAEAGRRASVGAPEQVLILQARSSTTAADEPEPEAIEHAISAGVSMSGYVTFGDGQPAFRAEVWNANAHSLAALDGSFELSMASAEQPLHATLRGFQPARVERPGRHGIVLQLGPQILGIEGRLRSVEGRESEGWRIALLDATLIEPARVDAATLESASSRSPLRVQCTADGSFSVDGLSPRPYTLAAWRATRERIELHAATPAAPDQGPIEIHVPPARECRAIELRCLDSKAAALAGLRVGLPGAPAIASTDEQGRLLLTGALPATLTLVLSTPDGSARSLVVDTATSADIVIDLPSVR